MSTGVSALPAVAAAVEGLEGEAEEDEEGIEDEEEEEGEAEEEGEEEAVAEAEEEAEEAEEEEEWRTHCEKTSPPGRGEPRRATPPR